MNPARPRIRGGEDAPAELTFAEAYIWTRLKLGYPTASADQHIVDDLRARGLHPHADRSDT